ncbi:hypothetical protein SAMN05660649_01005 [Desulfotomaculum arcticum]|uniref:Uncharacterized protein n=1 Tax=Desulfotruncus arcticus DSM 17038 TaxID=1121424 RepID=A0A1I2Q0A1_9FIRM|nr:hypothetical protein [Desulfotruncus arcticus]SFG21925.1 hypothetical protein SAMN05660649_01005 [Desulfotomaculum arcticum] [Desulfotruncus arcticus DSM 17038]
MNKTFYFSIYNECCGRHVHDYPQILVPLRKTLHICIGSLKYEVTSRELCFKLSYYLEKEQQLENKGMLMAGNFNQDRRDRTKYKKSRKGGGFKLKI